MNRTWITTSRSLSPVLISPSTSMRLPSGATSICSVMSERSMIVWPFTTVTPSWITRRSLMKMPSSRVVSGSFHWPNQITSPDSVSQTPTLPPKSVSVNGAMSGSVSPARRKIAPFFTMTSSSVVFELSSVVLTTQSPASFRSTSGLRSEPHVRPATGEGLPS